MDDIATDASYFWERRHDLDVVPTTTADVAARTDRGLRQLVVVARLADTPATPALHAASTELGAFECLSPIPRDDLHVTVKIVGDVVDDPTGPGEFASTREPALVDAIGNALTETGPFEASFPRYNLFPTVVYAEATTDGALERANRRLCEVAGIPTYERDGDGFVPHCTLAQFANRHRVETVFSFLERHRALSVPTVRVDRLALVAYEYRGRWPDATVVETFNLT